ncbi:Uncharacterised protein [Streptococcus pneumoniae]|nr:Uncharacterised protein [Streptococcus pneumoniae]
MRVNVKPARHLTSTSKSHDLSLKVLLKLVNYLLSKLCRIICMNIQIPLIRVYLEINGKNREWKKAKQA